MDLARRIDAERRVNAAAYAAVRDGLVTEAAGKWVVIAGGKLASFGATLEEVADVQPGALHRFVVHVGKDGPDERPYECFAGAWRGPYFAGPGLAAALHVTIDNTRGAALKLADGRNLGPFGVQPFPRFPLRVGAVSRVAKSPTRTIDLYAEPECLSPDVVVTPNDWQTLGLARFEIPNDMPIFGGILEAGSDLKMRKAHARVALTTDPSVTATIVAACPTFSDEGLVAVSRTYDRFWNDEARNEVAVAGRTGKWIVYGLDQVLAEAPTIEEVLTAAERVSATTYHRFVLKIPRGDPIHLAKSAFTDKRLATFGARGEIVVHEAEKGGEDQLGALLITPEVAASLCLEQFEEGRDVVLEGADQDKGLAAYAWETPTKGKRVLRLLVWDAPKPLYR